MGYFANSAVAGLMRQNNAAVLSFVTGPSINTRKSQKRAKTAIMEGKITIDRNEAGDVFLEVENAPEDPMAFLMTNEARAIMNVAEAMELAGKLRDTAIKATNAHIKRSRMDTETLTHREG